MEKREERVMEQRYKVVLVLALGTLLLTMGGRAAAQIEVPRITIPHG